MTRHRVHSVGNVAPKTQSERGILEELRELERSDVPSLKAKWKILLKRDPPRFAKRGFLTQVLAWEIQARAYGGLKPSSHRQLLALGKRGKDEQTTKTAKAPSPLRPGVKLVRSWRGQLHEVLVTEDGYLWRNQSYDSLSRIAREITGTRWSGPLFFGVRKPKMSSRVHAALDA